MTLDSSYVNLKYAIVFQWIDKITTLLNVQEPLETQEEKKSKHCYLPVRLLELVTFATLDKRVSFDVSISPLIVSLKNSASLGIQFL